MCPVQFRKLRFAAWVGGNLEQLSNSLFHSSGGGPCRLRVGRNAGTPHFEKRSIYDLSQETKHGVDELLTLVAVANDGRNRAAAIDFDFSGHVVGRSGSRHC